ncbi:DUF4153 domain-containing protein [Leptotrichia sp. OH3620_COT-345]|uniref:DUF4153 domain-containing protein n=1 Tax=Leptotrichia sp. OH3620_COT-345 TaxID=2491048 RepID=UPI000F64FB56|nr:DUF4153 domain-containing protein [Leptotrichia sp. OH3620_COT-345]RRD39529.1 DUF4153 domain-containing protein [Leptotrichia sp. OH3620_COT-345]
MTVIEKIKKIFPNMKKGIERFPITVSFSVITFGMLSYAIRIGELKGADAIPLELKKMIILLILGILITATLELIREKYFFNRNITVMRGISFITVSVLLFFIKIIYLSDKKISNFSELFFIGVISFLLFVLIPVINRKSDEEKYIQTVSLNIVVTIAFSVVLYLGIIAIIGAVDVLLINIDNMIYMQSFVFTVFVFGLTFFLSRLKGVNENLEEYETDVLFKILMKFIIIPLIIIYTGVLYLYLGKILIQMRMPKGVISHLVLWYTVFSLFIIIMITPMVKNDKMINLFRKNFPKVSIPLIILSLVAIFKRIEQYGVTEGRYYVVVVALWLLFCMFFYIFKTKMVVIIIGTFISVIFLAIYSPINAKNISILSQNKRLEKLLIQNGLVKAGKLVENPNLDNNTKSEIQSVVDYLLYNGNSMYSVKEREKTRNLKPFGKIYENPDDFKNSIGMDESWKSYYLEDKGINITYRIAEDIGHNDYISKTYGYEYLVRIYGYFVQNMDHQVYKKFSEKYIIMKNNDEIKILDKEDEKEILNVNINKILTEIISKKEFNVENNKSMEKIIPESIMEYMGETEKIKYKVAVKYINMKKDNNGTFFFKNYSLDFCFSEK